MIYIYACNNMEKATAVAELKNAIGEVELASYSEDKTFCALAHIASPEDYVFLLDEPKRRLSSKAIIKRRNSGEQVVSFVQRICIEEGWGEEEITQEKLDKLHMLALQLIDRQGTVSEEEVKAVVVDLAKRNYRFSVENHILAVEYVYNKLRGYGVLEEIVMNPAYSEVMVNGLDEILVEENGKLHGTGKAFSTKEDLMAIIRRLALDGGGKSIDEANPMLDAEIILKDGGGCRVNIVLDCVAKKGSTITIRKRARRNFTLDELIKEEDAREFIENMVKAGYNAFISGGTGSGKTTLLNAMAQKVSEDERIIIIEDTPEIQIEGKDNVVSLETRLANNEGNGGISCQALIRNTLRMRPDRIIVGEVRGIEVIDMLQAMNTGHDGSLSTGHANSSSDMIMRLETMAISEKEIPVRAIRMQIASALDVIVHVSRMRDGSRRVTEISEVQDLDRDGNVCVVPIWKFAENIKESTKEQVVGELIRTNNIFRNTDKFYARGYSEEVVKKLTKNTEVEIDDHIINNF